MCRLTQVRSVQIFIFTALTHKTFGAPVKEKIVSNVFPTYSDVCDKIMQTIGIRCFYLTRKRERKVEEEMPYEE